ncbi:MAG TPA: serine/threonine-protein kinase [Solirubrobacteraceae bacterium]|nr:serine/threonine-protein kinase [Solirubrobacteraceae bacterium]
METSKTLVQGDFRVADTRSRRRGELLLGRYRLLDRLGAGGFGTVWRAADEQLGRTVALKRIALPSPQERERALREAHATARLSHPAIVALYEACSDEEAFYLVSELIEGHTLAQLIEEDALGDEQIAAIGLALSEALAHAHARGVVHRDVKPQNVLVPDQEEEQSGRVGAPPPAKLADFGGALLAGSEALTRTGDVFGTLAYMAPEQSDGHAAGPAADLYSLGLVLYEAFSGHNPVRAATPAATARRIGQPIVPLRRHRRDLPRELTATLDATLVSDPDDRGDLDELREALAESLERGLGRQRLRRREARPTARRRRFQPEHPAEQSPEPASQTHLQPTLQPRLQPAAEPAQQRGAKRAVWALPRGVWLGAVLALALWQLAAGRSGVALLLLAAATPLLLLARRSGPGFFAAVAAPALGLAGLAGAFPALAGQLSGWRARAGLAALGFWWLALAEPLLARHLWWGPASGLPLRALWEGSLNSAVTHVLAPMLTARLALGALVWGVAAALLPWIVRGRNAALDLLAAIAWTVALLAAVPLLGGALHLRGAQATPRGAVLGAVLGCVLAICVRALRGPAKPAAE